MANIAFDGWCKPLSSRLCEDPFSRATFSLLSCADRTAKAKSPTADASAAPKQDTQRAPMIWPQTGSCTRREQLQKAAVDAVSVLLPHQLPAGASAFWPGLYVSDEDDKSDGYAESDAYDPYASEGEEPPSPSQVHSC